MFSFNGYNENILTFGLEGNAETGNLAKLCASETVRTCSAGDAFCGVIHNARNGAAAVQLKGYVETAYTGSAPSIGKAILAANGANGVKTAETGTEVLIIMVNTAKKTCGFII